MSTKTLRKRIALVAVSAMGFGLLTSVAANAASELAVAANGNTATTSRGIVSTNGTGGTSSLSASGVTSNYGSMLGSGSVYVTVSAGSSTNGVKVSGGYFSTCDSGSGSTATLGTTLTTCTNSAATTTLVTAVPNSGATTMTITSYTSSALTTAAGGITYTIVATASVGVFSASSSWFSTETSLTAAGDNVDATWTPSGGTTPVAAATERNAGAAGYFGYYAKDANGTDLTSPVVTAASTGGCLLNGSDSTGTTSSASLSTTSGAFRVNQPSSVAPATCTVTISVNGVAGGSRTFNFRGKLASVKLLGVDRVKAKAAATSASIAAAAYDSAGNALDNVSITADSSYYNAGLTTIGTITTAPFGLGATDGTASITCVAKGAYKMKLQATSVIGEVISSTEFTINCAGDPVNYTAALDKSSYVPGDIATLTITAKDSAGNLTNDAAAVGSSTYPVAIAGSNMTAVSAPSNVDTFTDGVKKYKFIVGSTEGSYQLSVDLPLWNSTTYNQSAQTVAYTIKASSASVSNAEVLAAIVKLIASINKQIAALQKALTKKK